MHQLPANTGTCGIVKHTTLKWKSTLARALEDITIVQVAYTQVHVHVERNPLLTVSNEGMEDWLQPVCVRAQCRSRVRALTAPVRDPGLISGQ